MVRRDFFPKAPVKLEAIVKKIVRVVRWQCKTEDTVRRNMSKPRGLNAVDKNKFNLDAFLGKLPEIKLKRTDTTLDLSQKAKRAKEEKKKRVKEAGGLGFI